MDKVTKAFIGEYKGFPTITLPTTSKYGFSFGLGKARSILANLEEIKAFVEVDDANGRAANE